MHSTESEAGHSASWLKSYARSLVRYHLHPETKFQGGEYDQRGPLKRRHVFALAQQSIGKEADNIEENEFIGEDAGPPDYGVVRHEPSTTTSTFSATSYPEARSASFERRRSGRGKPRPLRDRNRTFQDFVPLHSTCRDNTLAAPVRARVQTRVTSVGTYF